MHIYGSAPSPGYPGPPVSSTGAGESGTPGFQKERVNSPVAQEPGDSDRADDHRKRRADGRS